MSSSLLSELAKGAEKASCAEAVVQKGVFGESVSPHDAFSAPLGCALLTVGCEMSSALRLKRGMLNLTTLFCFLLAPTRPSIEHCQVSRQAPQSKMLKRGVSSSRGSS